MKRCKIVFCATEKMQLLIFAFQCFRHGTDNGNIIVRKTGNINYFFLLYIQQVVSCGVKYMSNANQNVITWISVSGFIVADDRFGNADTICKLLLS